MVIGVCISVIGIINMTGNISTIHSYNRRKVTEEDAPKYGRAVGLGTLIIGAAMVADGILVLLDLSGTVPYVLIPAVVVGLALILYAQIKYNHGIF